MKFYDLLHILEGILSAYRTAAVVNEHHTVMENNGAEKKSPKFWDVTTLGNCTKHHIQRVKELYTIW